MVIQYRPRHRLESNGRVEVDSTSTRPNGATPALDLFAPVTPDARAPVRIVPTPFARPVAAGPAPATPDQAPEPGGAPPDRAPEPGGQPDRAPGPGDTTRARSGRHGRVDERRARLAATALVVVTLAHSLAVAWLLGRATEVPGGSATPIPTPSASVPAGPTPLGGPSPLAPVAVPVGLAIPAIGVDERSLLELGRNPDGSLQVPTDFTRAGWFTGGSVPGEPGPSVIAGHVDSWRGPAVFFRLRDLRPGDPVTVRMSDGTAVRFQVDGVARYPKTAFPTEAVYGPVPGAALRLITCGGAFDRGARSYLDNIVVYASERP